MRTDPCAGRCDAAGIRQLVLAHRIVTVSENATRVLLVSLAADFSTVVALSVFGQAYLALLVEKVFLRNKELMDLVCLVCVCVRVLDGAYGVGTRSADIGVLVFLIAALLLLTIANAWVLLTEVENGSLCR